jgi:hypothetical protein
MVPLDTGIHIFSSDTFHIPFVAGTLLIACSEQTQYLSPSHMSHLNFGAFDFRVWDTRVIF